MTKVDFFLLCAAVGVVAGVIFWLFNFPLKSILHKESGPVPHVGPHEE
jgi:hypothetical protein